jgi:membrane peptidoglycan carboxypeptidase
MPLGELLLALPDSLMPKDWAREVQGTMDLDFWLEGPLHERTLWELDWEADFSRMSLAEGSLYSEVERLREPFPHEFQVLGDDGSLGDPIVRVIGAESGHFVPLHSISPVLVDAVLSSEDAGFFGHPGFEETEIKLALLENLRQGEGRGGSTITQQLAKNLFLSGERTLARKLKEAIVAWRLESALPKSRILEIYLNIAEWGPGLWGVRDAADHWFAKSPGALRAEEAAFLASLLPAPRRYHGYYHKPGGLTENRRAYVDDILSTMERLGRLTPEAAAEAKASAIELAPCGR